MRSSALRAASPAGRSRFRVRLNRLQDAGRGPFALDDSAMVLIEAAQFADLLRAPGLPHAVSA